jgi:hypothetical protein
MADAELGGEGTETLGPDECPDRGLLIDRQIAGAGTGAARSIVLRMRAVGTLRDVVRSGPTVGDRNPDSDGSDDR